MTLVVDWVRANAVPLTAVEAGRGFADLQCLRGFFQLKHRLLEFLVTELAFAIFGIEANYPECLRVNDYVLHGKGDPAEALAGTRFWTWDTEEVLALIEWMRSWNRAHARKVKF